MNILGIETSCDETGAAIVEANTGDKRVKLLSSIVASSLTLHSKTGGIVPEIAAREQLKYIIPVIEKALKDLSIAIDAIAVTVGPGLIGSLIVGVETAKTLAYVWRKPIVSVNHLIGHIYANFVGEISNLKSQISNNPIPDFPVLALIVSGGHTDLVLMKGHGSIEWLGGTRDDAAGEAFDKIGRLLGLPYPGGPSIEKTAKNGDPSSFAFPRPMIDSKDFDFSFSGLKTSVLYLIKKDPNVSVILGRTQSESVEDDSRISQRTDVGDSGRAPSMLARMTKEKEQLLSNVSASVQQAIIDVLVSKTLKAAQKYKVKSILLGGGVAANQKLRDEFIRNTQYLIPNTAIFAPQKSLCTDNAAMIATAAFFNYKPLPWQKLTANPELYFE